MRGSTSTGKDIEVCMDVGGRHWGCRPVALCDGCCPVAGEDVLLPSVQEVYDRRCRGERTGDARAHVAGIRDDRGAVEV